MHNPGHTTKKTVTKKKKRIGCLLRSSLRFFCITPRVGSAYDRADKLTTHWMEECTALCTTIGIILGMPRIAFKHTHTTCSHNVMHCENPSDSIAATCTCALKSRSRGADERCTHPLGHCCFADTFCPSPARTMSTAQEQLKRAYELRREAKVRRVRGKAPESRLHRYGMSASRSSKRCTKR